MKNWIVWKVVAGQLQVKKVKKKKLQKFLKKEEKM